jgi:LPPG:FO 2-phospho-L-lactate transferase
MRVVLLAGGYGGARLAHGLALLGAEVELSVVANTADDTELHGLHISPDLDTVMYTLAGLANPQTGWGVRDETWSANEMLARYGADTWFGLGDRDLATHVRRTALLRAGRSLTDVTAELAAALGVTARLLPMSDDSVRTKVRTADGWLEFQDYFVRRRHADAVLDLRFDGVEAARPTAQALDAVAAAELLVVGPSNPFVSIAPILALPGMLEAMSRAAAPVVAVSPIVAGAALRGPASDMFRSLGGEPSAAGVAVHYAKRYQGLLDTLVIDESDATQAERVAATGITPVAAPIVIDTDGRRRSLARRLLELASSRS